MNIDTPSTITEYLIIQHEGRFLKEMAEWEDRDLAHHEMGY